MVTSVEGILKGIYGEAKVEVENSNSIRIETPDYLAYLSRAGTYGLFKVYVAEIKNGHTFSEQDMEVLKSIAILVNSSPLIVGSENLKEVVNHGA